MLSVSHTVLSTGNTVVNQTDKTLHSRGKREATNKLKYKYLRVKYIHKVNI